jgi:hypothetical protein
VSDPEAREPAADGSAAGRESSSSADASEQPDLDARAARWRAAIREYSDEELLAETRRQLSNSGWVQMKAYYLRELRDEIERRKLTETDTYESLMTLVLFLDRI